ncbi:MAG: hypothetical protein C0623_02195 [Desulfuromonas sp.]|nr:MAG: hypothetical protein C0623_02195 [Desulfuromonas sp.]
MFGKVGTVSITILMLSAILLPATPVNAEYRFTDGTEMDIQWYEQENKILNNKVCFNYEKDRRKYRQCRRKAKDYFREECDFYEIKIRNTKKKKRHIYQDDKEKFCSAFESYQP